MLDYGVQRCQIIEVVFYIIVLVYGRIREDSGLRRCRIREV